MNQRDKSSRDHAEASTRSARETEAAATSSAREAAAAAARPCAALAEHLRERREQDGQPEYGNRAELQLIADGIARQQEAIGTAMKRLLKGATDKQS